jgi:UDPglucose 6-dehydrogenase/GDP-mannose 6-dehydrogenase
MQILDAVMNVNAAQPLKVIASLQKRFPCLKGVRVAVLGLAFKPGTDDVRESPSISVIMELLAQHALVKVFDPAAQNEARKILNNGSVNFAENLAEAVSEAQAILLLTRWPEFEALPDLISTLKESPILIDGRRMLNKHSVEKYEGIGLSRTAETCRT